MSNSKRYNIYISIVCILVIILVAHMIIYGHRNTIRVIGCASNGECSIQNVHRQHGDPISAASLLTEISSRTELLIEHLQKKYTPESNVTNSEKNNNIDIIGSSELYTDPVSETEYIRERISQLIYNYDADRIYEISPLNKSGVTSYAENKRTLILCLRKKIPNSLGEYELHDINTMMFVVLHELTHMMNDKWGHDENTNFWSLFKVMLVNASEIGIYNPIDYSKKPIVYCGLKLAYNPFFDTRLV